ncbi:MAG TPA: diguanylate cyclase, partial [Cyanophyceae cyanobacterium]
YRIRVVEVFASSSQCQDLSSPELDITMDACVLVVGNDRFLALLVSQIRNMTSGRVETSCDIDEVVPLIRDTQPAIVILQTTLVGALELCEQIKKQTQFSWIYCILIDERQTITGEDISRDWRRDLTTWAEALENGADAYLQLTFTNIENLEEQRLLKAQIQTGLRGIQFYQELMQTNDVLSTMALADPLTELSNRRAMEWDLPRQIQYARSQSSPLSLIMLDVDYFKSVNDTYGHQVGDRVLKLLAARLQHNLRFEDTLFRYGGEEFVIILNQTNLHDAYTVAKRLRGLIGDQPFNIDGMLALPITISLGLASLNSTDDIKGESLLRRADYNLLQAKASGRNQVVYEEN